MIPANYKLIYSRQQINSRIQEMGREMTSWAESSSTAGSDVIVMPVLRGGIFFFADLVRAMPCTLEMAPGRIRSYNSESNTQVDIEQMEINIDSVDVADRKVLLVDDICDSGRTMKILKQHLLERGAAEVRSAVLIKRIHEASVFDPDWVGFAYEGAEWFVGYGMEDRNRWMNLPEVYIIG